MEGTWVYCMVLEHTQSFTVARYWYALGFRGSRRMAFCRTPGTSVTLPSTFLV